MSEDALVDQLRSALGSAYAIERELGGGGMSRVFLAEEVRFKRRVVIKVLAPDLAVGLSSERFEREISLAAALQEPHIVPVLTAGTTTGGVPYYTMPFIEGESLRDRLQRGTLPQNEAVSILRNVAQALAYAHGRGIVHRDIKPENVLLSSGTAVVTDFGIAKAVQVSRTGGPPTQPDDAITQLGTSLGTPAYMAPEQAAGDPDVDARADIYAWGVMAYELLAGAHPFAGRSPHQLVLAHMTEHPAALSAHCCTCPEGLVNLVMRSMEKEPARRPQSAMQLLSSLDAPMVSVHRTRPLGPRTRVLALGVALVATGIAAWLAFYRAPAAPANARVIAVAPFRVSGADPSLSYLREGMIDLLATKLAAGTLSHAVDPRTLLAAWRKESGGDTDLEPGRAARVARTVGAGQLLLGSIAGSTRALTLNAVLLGSAKGDTVATVEVNGPADSLPALVDQLAARLLSLRAGMAQHQLASATSTSLPALRAYLEGRALFRRGRFEEAARQFAASLDADSTFALGGLGLLSAAGWATKIDPRRGLDVLRRHKDRLTVRDRLAAEIELSQGSPGRFRAAAESLMTIAPDSPEASYNMGEWTFHYGRLAGLEDADARALALFNRSITLDSSFAPPWEHLVALHLAREDTARARGALNGMVALDSAADALPGAQFILAVATGDSVRAREIRSRFSTLDKQSLNPIIEEARFGRYVSVGDGMRALAESQRVGLSDVVVASALLDWGQPGASSVALRRRDRGGGPMWAVINHAFSDGVAEDARIGADSLEKRMQRMPRNSPQGILSAWVLGVYRMAAGDTVRTRASIATLRSIALPAGDSLGSSSMRDVAVLQLETQLAVVQRSANLRTLTMRLDQAVQSGTGNVLMGMTSALVLARAWEQLGDLPRAREAAGRHVRFLGMWQFWAPNLREQARLAERAGDIQDAKRAWRSYLRLRANAEPSMKADLDAARAALARLEGMSTGR